MVLGNDKIKIVPFENRYAEAFKQLNLEWLETYDLLEPADLEYLDYPEQVIVEPGGRILMAIDGDTVIGTCAIVKETGKSVELAKLAVSPDSRGKGIGRLLTMKSIKEAQEMGFEKMILVSNTKLVAAVKLYESLGFRHAPVPEDIIYATADVYMELILDQGLPVK